MLPSERSTSTGRCCQIRQPEEIKYPAKSSYADYDTAVHYERERFSGAIGRYRRYRELRAVRAIMGDLPDGVSILDCPCGNGRWWDMLTTKASDLKGVDVSEGMLRYARERAEIEQIAVEIFRGDAEDLPLEDDSVDYTFSFALTKHLPRPLQYRVLSEFARVSRRGVIATFGVFTQLSYAIWRRRGIESSYPLIREELDWMASGAGLSVDRVERCTTPIGVERVVLMRKPRG